MDQDCLFHKEEKKWNGKLEITDQYKIQIA